MAETSKELIRQLEKLKAQAEAVREREIAGVISRIKEAIEAYGITASDLGFEESAKSRSLRQAIDPWIGWNDDDKSEPEGNEAQLSNEGLDALLTEDANILRENRRREAQQMLKVIVGASVEDVSKETRAVQYSHVHILAHGAPLEDVGSGQSLYGLCFRGERGGIDVVDGVNRPAFRGGSFD